MAVQANLLRTSSGKWMDAVIPAHISEFLRSAIRSVWAIDLLLILKKAPGRIWTVDGLTYELRGSVPLVKNILEGFGRWGLVLEDPPGAYRYAANTDLDKTVTELLEIYSERPVAVIRETTLAPNETIHAFVEAFRLKKD